MQTTIGTPPSFLLQQQQQEADSYIFDVNLRQKWLFSEENATLSRTVGPSAMPSRIRTGTDTIAQRFYPSNIKQHIAATQRSCPSSK